MCNYLGMPLLNIIFKGDKDHRVGKAWGKIFYADNTIYISTRSISLKYIYHTLAHELIHASFPKLVHGVNYEKYVVALIRRHMFFDGRGLITKTPKLKPEKTEIKRTIEEKIKRYNTKIKRLTTLKRKAERRLKRLNKD